MNETTEIKHYTSHWHTSPYPLMVGFGTGFFLPWAFMFQYNYEMGLMAVITLAIGALLTIIGGLGWAGQTIGVVTDEGWSPSAMLMFIGTEVMTIAAIVAGYWTMRIGATEWPPAGTPEIDAPVAATVILIVSSITIGLARKHQLNGNISGFSNMVMASVALWIVFMVLTISGWRELIDQGFVLGSNGYATVLYGITGIHFAHVVFGLLIMLTCLPSAFKNRTSPSYTRAMTMYVHFVNVLGVWVLLQVYYA